MPTRATAIRAGGSGIPLEDQVAPKKCGHMIGKAVVSVNETVAKSHVSFNAWVTDRVVIARTDALAAEGLNLAMHPDIAPGAVLIDEVIRPRESGLNNRGESTG